MAMGEGKTPKEIARYHPRRGSRSSGQTTYLEIRPEGMPILDLIVITWVVAETGRKEQAKRQVSYVS